MYFIYIMLKKCTQDSSKIVMIDIAERCDDLLQ